MSALCPDACSSRAFAQPPPRPCGASPRARGAWLDGRVMLLVAVVCGVSRAAPNGGVAGGDAHASGLPDASSRQRGGARQLHALRGGGGTANENIPPHAVGELDRLAAKYTAGSGGASSFHPAVLQAKKDADLAAAAGLGLSAAQAAPAGGTMLTFEVRERGG